MRCSGKVSLENGSSHESVKSSVTSLGDMIHSAGGCGEASTTRV